MSNQKTYYDWGFDPEKCGRIEWKEEGIFEKEGAPGKETTTFKIILNKDMLTNNFDDIPDDIKSELKKIY